MKSHQVIFDKLEFFIKKFYINELLKGLIFFLGMGLLYFLFTLFIEYFMWLQPFPRLILFWSFVFVEIILFVRFILIPLSKLFKLQKGIDYNQASSIIGNHFSEVNDKLINFLQLSESSQQSDLLLASIDQKALSLTPIPFSNAIDFKSNRKFLPILLIPFLIFNFFIISGRSDILSQSYNRVVHYNQRFVPPAPFKFMILSNNLSTLQHQDFILEVALVGKVFPENLKIIINDSEFFMEPTSTGKFKYTFESPLTDQKFHLLANNIQSSDYILNVSSVPSISSFYLNLKYPKYLKRSNEHLSGTGSVVVPEGTIIEWNINAIATDAISFVLYKSFFPFTRENSTFSFERIFSQSTDYDLITSNSKIKNFEKLQYHIEVTKDQYPSIDLSTPSDSLKLTSNYLFGKISDDYGFSRLNIVYYPKDFPNKVKRGTLPIKGSVYDQFVFAFPSNLPVESGVTYEYYFEVFDNDALHHFKSTKSSVFSNRILSESEIQEDLLIQQNDNINSLDKSIRSKTAQLSELDKLQKLGKEKDNFNFKDQQKVSDFIQRQKQQDELMKQFTSKLKDNLEKSTPKEKDPLKEALEKRIDNAEKEIEKNSKLLDELKSLQDKIKNDEFVQKLDKFKQNSVNQTKNLQQLVELTKKFYVEKKAEQLALKLDNLSQKQDQLSNEDKENTSTKQDEINKEFDKIDKELDALDKDNKELKSPLSLPDDSKKVQSIEEDLDKAKDALEKQNKSKAKSKQKDASKKMKEMSIKIKESMEGGEQEQLEEDVKMLRQVLDNLLAFSFSQEDLLLHFKTMRVGNPSFNKYLKVQQNLKQQFNHIDDSLFALSLRNEKIAENITKEIGTIHYNLDKSTDTFVDANFPKGVSHQQYVISAANRLADFLSDILNNLQMSLNGSGSGSGKKPKPGSGEGMQLSDIIKKQQGLGAKMGESKSKNDGKGKEGESKGASGSKQGKSNGDGTKSSDDGEGDAGELLRIYQEQQNLREALEQELQKSGMGNNGKGVLDQMKQLEKQLLNRGIDKQAIQKALNIQYELLKLEKALQQQGEDLKKQANTNKRNFNNTAPSLPKSVQDYMQGVEILNRQTLPFDTQTQQKVQTYFNKR